MALTRGVKVSEEVLARLKELRKLLNAKDLDTVIWLMTKERPP